VSTRRLRAVFVVVLAAAGVRMLLGHGDGGAATDAAVASGAAAIATAALIGFGGGFVAPLLGIGGGLVFVPALYLALPSLGFAGARACSLAASIVASARALRLYRAGREVSGAHAAFLAVGAVAGAVLGVTTVHLPGLAELGRHGLALVLLFVSGRFLCDAFRDRAGAGDQA
jgi:uncharacterized membrane protein YfcA